MPVNYKNGKIYTIRSHQTDEVYVGSTTLPLSKRLYAHKKDFKRWKDGKSSYVSSFEILKFEDAYIELFENCECDKKELLNKREGEVIRNTENCVNRYVAGMTKKKYKIDNRGQIAERDRQYYNENKEQIAEQKSKYYNENKEQIAEYQKEYRLKNKEQIAEQKSKYYNENKEQIAERDRQYYINNKEHILERKKNQRQRKKQISPNNS